MLFLHTPAHTDTKKMSKLSVISYIMSKYNNYICHLKLHKYFRDSDLSMVYENKTDEAK